MSTLQSPPRCRRCGEVIGVYEPLVVVSQHEPRRTSLAAAGQALPPGSAAYHEACFEHAELADASAA